MSEEAKRAGENIAVIDRSDAPELYVDGYQGVIMSNNVLKFNLYSLRINPLNGQSERVVNARLVMSISAMMAIHDGLGQLLKDLHSKGFINIDQGDK